MLAPLVLWSAFVEHSSVAGAAVLAIVMLAVLLDVGAFEGES